jgi:hypothetical protein
LKIKVNFIFLFFKFFIFYNLKDKDTCDDSDAQKNEKIIDLGYLKFLANNFLVNNIKNKSIKFNQSITLNCDNSLKNILDDYFQTKSNKAKLEVKWFYNGQLLLKSNKK